MEVEKNMLCIKTLEEALERIKVLEIEVKNLTEENEKLRKGKASGRKKHDKKWTDAYNDFVIKYESGMAMVEIIRSSDISRRTAYRYLKYYREVNKH